MTDQRSVTGRRAVAFVIDTVLGFVIFWSLVVALGTEVGQRPGISITMMSEIVNGQMYAELFGTVYRLDGGAATVVILTAMGYWIGMLVVAQGLTGRTLGKRVVGICTVSVEGRPCGIGRAMIRWLFLVVDAFPYFVPMLVGFIVTVSSPNRQRVGDIVAKTWVVFDDAIGRPIANETTQTQRYERNRAPSPSRSIAENHRSAWRSPRDPGSGDDELDRLHSRLLSDLEAIVTLLRRRREDQWAEWIDRARQRIASYDDHALESLLSVYGASGSFNDLVLHPVNSHAVQPDNLDESNQQLARLRSQTWRTATAMRHALHQ